MDVGTDASFQRQQSSQTKKTLKKLRSVKVANLGRFRLSLKKNKSRMDIPSHDDDRHVENPLEEASTGKAPNYMKDTSSSSARKGKPSAEVKSFKRASSIKWLKKKSSFKKVSSKGGMRIYPSEESAIGRMSNLGPHPTFQDNGVTAGVGSADFLNDGAESSTSSCGGGAQVAVRTMAKSRSIKLTRVRSVKLSRRLPKSKLGTTSRFSPKAETNGEIQSYLEQHEEAPINASQRRIIRTLSKSRSLRSRRQVEKKGVRNARTRFDQATCSSTQKISRISQGLDLVSRGSEADEHPILHVCPYSYCSVHGDKRAGLPSLKGFVAAKRRTLKKQKSRRVTQKYTASSEISEATEESREMASEGEDSDMTNITEETSHKGGSDGMKISKMREMQSPRSIHDGDTIEVNSCMGDDETEARVSPIDEISMPIRISLKPEMLSGSPTGRIVKEPAKAKQDTTDFSELSDQSLATDNSLLENIPNMWDLIVSRYLQPKIEQTDEVAGKDQGGPDTMDSSQSKHEKKQDLDNADKENRELNQDEAIQLAQEAVDELLRINEESDDYQQVATVERDSQRLEPRDSTPIDPVRGNFERTNTKDDKGKSLNPKNPEAVDGHTSAPKRGDPEEMQSPRSIHDENTIEVKSCMGGDETEARVFQIDEISMPIRISLKPEMLSESPTGRIVKEPAKAKQDTTDSSELSDQSLATDNSPLGKENIPNMWDLIFSHYLQPKIEQTDEVAGKDQGGPDTMFSSQSKHENKQDMDMRDEDENEEENEHEDENENEEESEDGDEIEDEDANKENRELNQDEAIQLAQEAVDELLRINEESADCQRVTTVERDSQRLEPRDSTPMDPVRENFERKNAKDDKGTSLDPKNPEEVDEHTSAPKKGDSEGKLLERQASKGLAKLRRMIITAKTIKAMEKLMKIKSRKPQTLSSVASSDTNKALLRHRSMESKSSAEELMLDHALQQVIAKLDPDQQRRVTLLIKAFETMSPELGGKGKRSNRRSLQIANYTASHDGIYVTSDLDHSMLSGKGTPEPDGTTSPSYANDSMGSPASSDDEHIGEVETGIRAGPVPYGTPQELCNQNIMKPSKESHEQVHSGEEAQAAASLVTCEMQASECDKGDEASKRTLNFLDSAHKVCKPSVDDQQISLAEDQGSSLEEENSQQSLGSDVLAKQFKTTEETNEALEIQRQYSLGGSEVIGEGTNLQFDKHKFTNVWNMVYQHFVASEPFESGNKQNLGSAEKEQDEDTRNIRLIDRSDSGTSQKGLNQADAVQLVQEAIDELLRLQGQLSDQQSTSAHNVQNSGSNGEKINAREPPSRIQDQKEVNTSSEQDGMQTEPEELESKEQDPVQAQPSKAYGRLKSLMVSTKFIKAMQKLRKISPKRWQNLSLKADSGPERVYLRHLSMDERRNSEEWMLDYALQQVLGKMDPAQQRRVAMLTQVFESITPEIQEINAKQWLSSMQTANTVHLGENGEGITSEVQESPRTSDTKVQQLEDNVQALADGSNDAIQHSIFPSGEERMDGVTIPDLSGELYKDSVEFKDDNLHLHGTDGSKDGCPVCYLEPSLTIGGEDVNSTKEQEAQQLEDNVQALADGSNDALQHSIFPSGEERMDGVTIPDLSGELYKDSVRFKGVNLHLHGTDGSKEGCPVCYSERSLTIGGEDVNSTKEQELHKLQSPREEAEQRNNIDVTQAKLKGRDNSKIWNLIYQQVKSKAAKDIDGQINEASSNGEQDNSSAFGTERESKGTSQVGVDLELSQSDVTKVVQEALEGILKQNHLGQNLSKEDEDDGRKLKNLNQGFSNESSRQEEDKFNKGTISRLEEDNIVLETNKSIKKTFQPYSRWKRALICSKFVTAMEKMQKFHPQRRRNNATESDEGAEVVNLRRCLQDDRSHREEWMFDYALQQVISKLGPAQQKRVATIVEAFETVAPSDQEESSKQSCNWNLEPSNGVSTARNDERREIGDRHVPGDKTLQENNEAISSRSHEKGEGEAGVEQRTGGSLKSRESVIVDVPEKQKSNRSMAMSNAIQLQPEESIERQAVLSNPHTTNGSIKGSSKLEELEDHNSTKDMSDILSGKQRHTSMWKLMRKHLNASTTQIMEEQSPGKPDVDKMPLEKMEKEVYSCQSSIGSNQNEVDEVQDKDSKSINVQQAEAIKMVQEAVDEILHIQEPTRGDQSTTASPTLKQAELCAPCDETVEMQEGNSSHDHEKLARSYSAMSKIILCNKFIKAMEKLKKSRSRSRWSIPRQNSLDGETVTLRPQTTNEKHDDEWMLDNALQQVIGKLGPAQKKKVSSLVDAFEKLNPSLDTKTSPRLKTIAW